VNKITDINKKHNQLFFKLCSDHLSIEAIPKTSLKIDFFKLKESPPAKYEIMMWTPRLVVLKNPKGQEITLRRDGRMVIRKAESEPEAERAAIEVMRLVESNIVGQK